MYNNNLDTCNICLKLNRRSYKLNLNCECKYNVHKKCFMDWWNQNHNCIICLTECPEPYKKKSFIDKRRKRIKTRLRIRYRNNRTNFSIHDVENNDQLSLHYSDNNNLFNYNLCYFIQIIIIFFILFYYYTIQ